MLCVRGVRSAVCGRGVKCCVWKGCKVLCVGGVKSAVCGSGVKCCIWEGREVL